MASAQLWVAVILAVVQLATTVVLFLVGKLLQDNKEAISELRTAIRDVTLANNGAIRDLATIIESIRRQVSQIEVSVAKLDALREFLHEERQERHRAG